MEGMQWSRTGLSEINKNNDAYMCNSNNSELRESRENSRVFPFPGALRERGKNPVFSLPWTLRESRENLREFPFTVKNLTNWLHTFTGKGLCDSRERENMRKFPYFP